MYSLVTLFITFFTISAYPQSQKDSLILLKDTLQSTCNLKRHGSAIELQNGYLFVAGKNMPPNVISTLSISYLYQFNNLFSLGLWFGVPFAGYFDGQIASTGFWNPPLCGIRTVWGNKIDSYAVAINIGILPSIGVYRKNMFLNLFLLPYNSVMKPYQGTSHWLVYLESGYSFTFDQIGRGIHKLKWKNSK
jgi:hypothetical protein